VIDGLTDKNKRINAILDLDGKVTAKQEQSAFKILSMEKI
jgi:hypothetical protein